MSLLSIVHRGICKSPLASTVGLREGGSMCQCDEGIKYTYQVPLQFSIALPSHLFYHHWTLQASPEIPTLPLLIPSLGLSILFP